MRWLLLSIGDTSIKLTWCSNNSMNKIQYYNKTPLFTPRLLCEELNGPLFISSLKWRELWTWGHKSPTPQAGKHNKAEQSEDVRESSAASAFISLFVCLFICLNFNYLAHFHVVFTPLALLELRRHQRRCELTNERGRHSVRSWRGSELPLAG